MESVVKTLKDLIVDEERSLIKESEWDIRGIQSDQCLSYVVWNTRAKVAVIVDPKDEDLKSYRTVIKSLTGYTWIAVIDTHTHADHISIAASLAKEISAPLIMHVLSPSNRVSIRISQDTHLPTSAGPIIFLHTPGHTQDAMTIIWGPFLFGGDTLLYGDTGRDDLPGGDAKDHYESLQKIKKYAVNSLFVLPGHDHKKGRVSTWTTQLKVNVSLTQPREQFVKEAEEFDAPAPALLKKSLKENFK